MLVGVVSYGGAHFTERDPASREPVKYILDKENDKWVDL